MSPIVQNSPLLLQLTRGDSQADRPLRPPRNPWLERMLMLYALVQLHAKDEPFSENNKRNGSSGLEIKIFSNTDILRNTPTLALIRLIVHASPVSFSFFHGRGPEEPNTHTPLTIAFFSFCFFPCQTQRIRRRACGCTAEVLDFGYPQILTPEILKLYITQEGVRTERKQKKSASDKKATLQVRSRH